MLMDGDFVLGDTTRSIRSLFGTLEAGADTVEEREKLLKTLVQLALGPGVPPPFIVAIRNEVSMAELTAPLVGFGVVPTASASITSPWATFQWWGSFCMRANQCRGAMSAGNLEFAQIEVSPAHQDTRRAFF